MNWKSGIIAGLAALIVNLAFSQIMGVLYPSFMQEMQNTNIFRPYSDPLMLLFFAYPVILGIVLNYLWNLVQAKLKGKTLWGKSVRFANLYFLIGTFPGMFVTYTSMEVSFMAILIWSITGYLEVFTAAAVYQKVK